MGTDVRKLVYDGYPAANVLGCDLRQEFLDYGHTLFGDRGRCAIRFFASDIFAVPYPPPADQPPSDIALGSVTHLAQLRGRIDHFYTGALFHLFDEKTQYALALRVAALLRRAPGAVVFGRHQGLEREGYIDDHLGRCVLAYGLLACADMAGSTRYGHSPASWTTLWKKVFAEVESPAWAESHVEVRAELKGAIAPNVFRARAPTNMLYWSVKII